VTSVPLFVRSPGGALVTISAVLAQSRSPLTLITLPGAGSGLSSGLRKPSGASAIRPAGRGFVGGTHAAA
jgi:hypothetical protein